MSMSAGQQNAHGISDFVRDVGRRGVRLWVDGGQLHYRAPKGVLTRDELDKIRTCRAQVIALLQEGIAPDWPRLERRPEPSRAPLTFSQLEHWNSRRLQEVPGIRQLLSATRVRGRLDPAVLRDSVAYLIDRHAALRTHISMEDGVPSQKISNVGACEWGIEDLTRVGATDLRAVIGQITDQLVLAPVALASDPLFAVRLLTLGEEDQVLVIAMEHMISDARSMNIFLRELLEVYRTLASGRAVSLPPVEIQFPDYAAWQRDTHQFWLARHQDYWNERLRGCARVEFRTDGRADPTLIGWGTVPIRIGRALKAGLREWCKVHRTTLVMSVFTAYVALVLRWCDVHTAVVRYQTDGRAIPKLDNSIGFFAGVLYLRMDLFDGDDLIDLMQRLTKEYCDAHEHADSSYIESQLPKPPFACNGRFNWVPAASRLDLSGSQDIREAAPFWSVPFAPAMLRKYTRDAEPTVLLYDIDDVIVGGVHFPSNRFSSEIMARFVESFVMFLEALIRNPRRRVAELALADQLSSAEPECPAIRRGRCGHP